MEVQGYSGMLVGRSIASDRNDFIRSGKGLAVNAYDEFHLLIADIIPVAILTGFHWAAMILRPSVMHEHFELKLVEQKGEIDVATYENPTFQDLLTKVEGQGIYPMVALLEAAPPNP